MKILMISDVYFPRVNGVSTSIESFRRALTRLGHSVTLICPAYPAGHEDDSGIRRIRSRGVLTDPEDRMMYYRRILALAPELAAQGFDLIHVHTPFVAHYAGRALYRAADVFVFASRTETQGLVLLEAMALGTPVVSTAVMGTRDVLCDGEGCLVAEDDEAAFAAKVNRLLEDTLLRSELAQRALVFAGRWHEDAQAIALLDCYQSQLAPKEEVAQPSIGSP